MKSKVRIWRRTWLGRNDLHAWHWWCPCCVGGDWNSTWGHAVADALRHVEQAH